MWQGSSGISLLVESNVFVNWLSAPLPIYKQIYSFTSDKFLCKILICDLG